MPYTPTTWVDDGDPPISAANLNKLETGVKDAHDVIATSGAHYIQATEPAMVDGDFWTKATIPADYSATVLADSPMVYMRNDTATMTDSSGNSRTPTGVGTVTTGEPALVLGGTACWKYPSSGYQKWAYSSWMNVTSVTMEAWIKGSNFSGGTAIWDRDEGSNYRLWRLWVRSDGKLEMTYWYATGFLSILTGTTTLALNTTHHVAATYDAATGVARLYVNGVQDATNTNAGGLHTSTGVGLGLGATMWGPGNNKFNGWIDEAAVYPLALSAERISAHYVSGSAGGAPTFYGLYQRVGGVTVPVAGPSVIKDEGVALALRQALDFVGSGVTATDDSAGNRTVITIPGAAGGGGTTLLSGTGAPTAGTGSNGNYYVDTSASILYGPKNDSGFGAEQSVFTNETLTPQALTGGYTVGSDITFAVAGRITGLKWHKPAGNGENTHTLYAWNPSTSAKLGQATTSSEVGLSGMITATLATPITVTAGQTVRVSVDMTVDQATFKSSGAITNGDLTLGAQGYYGSLNSYPTTTTANRYVVDVVFQKTTATVWPIAIGSTGGHTIQDEGSVLTARGGLNFVGSGITATDDAANNRTVVTVASAVTAAPDVYTASVTPNDTGSTSRTLITLTPSSPTPRPGLYLVMGRVSHTTGSGQWKLQATTDGFSAVTNLAEHGTHFVSKGYGWGQNTFLWDGTGTLQFRQQFVSEGTSITFGENNDDKWARVIIAVGPLGGSGPQGPQGPQGLPGTSGHTVQDEGSTLATRTKLNFVGSGVAVTDDSANDATLVTITGGGGGGGAAITYSTAPPSSPSTGDVWIERSA